jgi:tetratricopeptide (TPR) repeat protein
MDVASGQGRHSSERGAGALLPLAPSPAPAPLVNPHEDGTTLRELSRAIALQQKGRLDDAERVYASLLAQADRDPTVLVNAGVLALARGDVASSIQRLQRAVDVAPSNAVAQGNFGFALMHAGRDVEALAALDRAIALKPDFAHAHNNRGVALVRLKRRDDAIRAFQRALDLLPAYAEAAINLGETHNRAGDAAQARAAFTRVRSGEAAHASARVGIAFAEALDGRLDEAIASLEAIVAVEHASIPAWHTLGAVRNWAWRHEAAEAAFRQALRLDATHRDARFGVAATLLARGRYREGWQAFEASRELFLPTSALLRTLPAWHGEPLDGTLAIHGEQGLGDVVQFARFVASVRSRVARIVLMLDGYWRPLAPLLASLPGADRVVTDEAELASEQPTARVSMLSLAFLCEAEPATLPRPPYLRAPPDRVDAWRAALARLPAPRVGLAWSVFARDDHGYVTRHKSLSSAALRPIVDVPGVSFVGLQPGVPAEPGVLEVGDRLHDFGDTAALIDTLDLVITPDTAVAHVAGAMGKPVWLMERYHGCWRWRLDATATPWYPTLRIYRQARFNDWRDVVERIAADLATFRDDYQ